MRTKVMLIFILLISNIAWSYFYLNEDIPKNNNDVQIYILEGSDENWEVKNYKIVVTSEKILRGHAQVIYLGDPTAIKDSIYFDITFYEENHKKEQTVVYSRSASSTGGSVSIINNLDLNDVGAIISPYSYDEKLRTKENYKNSTVEISWNDKSGEIHKEKIYLKIIDEIIIKDDE